MTLTGLRSTYRSSKRRVWLRLGRWGASGSVERIFNAPRDRVWQAMTKPELWTNGGAAATRSWWSAWSSRRQGIGASSSTRPWHPWLRRRYSEIVPPERVVQTIEGDGMPGHIVLETMTLEDLGGGRTKLVNLSLFMTAADRDGMISSGMEEGIAQSYEGLDRVLAA